ncbi:unnamed protein product [Peronospora belbahrii]|uniref:Uncharacterized protein n=1 Tax=Peronospora belbahrii TaxID=622444 RepID=A0AAU9L310_9STRA|nr:unnamed protein product [Peronospora belbahrii]CAH0517440.1 unnamed protein product [Peronospora belbahrii]
MASVVPIVPHKYCEGLLLVGAGVVRTLSGLNSLRNFRRRAPVRFRAHALGVGVGWVKCCRHEGRACEKRHGEREAHIAGLAWRRCMHAFDCQTTT